eukprot:snap_masked-scaffold432_size172395-processed-gene-0.3 protein:Tk09205 transcript:snap_masked-scaffold432_size172395-processed-gene-0.3-mRNA-1 annotation:"hypothetical protein H257_06278"
MPKVSKKQDPKDPKAPKRASSAYLLYSNETRVDVRASHPGKSMIEVTKEIAARWHQVSPETKAKYQALADQDKERYGQEMADYVPPPEADENANGQGPEKRLKKKMKADPNKPKKPTSAYFFFMASTRPSVKAKHPGQSVSEMAKIMGQMWSQTSEAERKPFNKQAERDKIRYEAEKKVYEG